MTILSWNDMWKLVTLLDSVTVVLSICACHHWNECIWNIFAISKFKCLSWPVQHGRALRKTAYRNSNCGARHPAKWPGGTNGDQKETSTMRAPSVSKNTPYDPQQRGTSLFFSFLFGPVFSLACTCHMTCPTCTDAWHSIEFMVWHVLLFIAHVSILLKNDTLCGIMLGMYQRLSTYRPTLYWHIYVLVSMRRSNCYCWNSSWKTCVPQWLDNLSDRHDTNKGG